MRPLLLLSTLAFLAHCTPVPPSAVLQVPERVVVNTSFALDGRASHAVEGALQYRWQLDPEAPALITTDGLVTHRYTSTGTHVVVLTVRDQAGAESTAAAEVEVVESFTNVTDGGVSADGSTPDAAVVRPLDGGRRGCVSGERESCSCDNGGMGVRTCRENGMFGRCACGDAVDAGMPPLPMGLERVRAGMLGRWIGTRETEWDGVQPVEVIFRADGRYDARCLAVNCVAYYWGLDVNHPRKTWALGDLHDNGEASGYLHVLMDADTVRRGELRRVRLSDDQLELNYEFWNTWADGERGPVVFSVSRALD